jgi:hypothetical protein
MYVPTYIVTVVTNDMLKANHHFQTSFVDALQVLSYFPRAFQFLVAGKKHFKTELSRVFARPGDQPQKLPDLFRTARQPLKSREQEYPTTERSHPGKNGYGGADNIRKYFRSPLRVEGSAAEG